MGGILAFHSNWASKAIGLTIVLLGLGIVLPLPVRAVDAPHSPPSYDTPEALEGDATSARDEIGVLPPDWHGSGDQLWTLRGDSTGAHLLMADQADAYAWRTVASLAEPGLETDRWVGNACLTESGRRAVVVYAPRAYTNHGGTFNRGGFVAVVDTSSGAVEKLPLRASLAYFNPGCGTGERVVLTQQRAPEEAGGQRGATRLFVVDTTTMEVTTPVPVQPGQLTSAVPVRRGIAAAAGNSIVSLRGRNRVVLAKTATTPAYLTIDKASRVLFVAGSRSRNAVRRVTTTRARQRPAVVAESRGTWLGLGRGVGGRTFLLGADADVRIPSAVIQVVATSDAEVSTWGQAVLKHEAMAQPDSQKRRTDQDLLSYEPDRAMPQELTVVLRNGATLHFTVTPGLRPSRRLAEGRDGIEELPPAAEASPSTQGAPRQAPIDDAGATCAVPRNDPRSQVYQPTPRQVEWAVNQAVVDNLRMTRPANWKQSGLPSYTPQGMFGSKPLSGGGVVPSQVLLGILAQESNLWQASGHALSGVSGNPLVGNFYGREVYDDDASNDWIINFADADCGYGVGQITDGMRKAGSERPGETALPPSQQRAIALDYTANIARSLQVLQEKWNQTRDAGMIVNNGVPNKIENWTYAIWAYNSGFYPRSTAGQPWGVGWLNNPANPIYPPDRHFFNSVGSDAAHPQDWPYQEKVIGWAAYSIATPDGPGFRPAWWLSDLDRRNAIADPDTFCTAATDCYYGESYQPNDPEVSGAPAGPCAHKNAAGLYDLKCWHNAATTYRADCADNYCGNELRRFNTSYPEQPDGTNYPPVCTTTGLPSGALIVDDVASSTPSNRTGCGHPWIDRGTFALSVDHASARVDAHQIGAGFGGHFWFAHTRKSDAEAGRLEVTGTWTFTDALNQWGRVLVHVPDHGAHTQQAGYRINLGNGVVKTRYALQRTRANRWISLGVFQFAGKPVISLSSETYDGSGSDDVAWDAVAIQPLASKPSQFVVALGDSYSSGEGANDPEGGDDYYRETDVNGDLDDDKGRNACHRSPFAWARQAVFKDTPSRSLGERADTWDPSLDFQFHACSGAETEHVLPYHSVPTGSPKPTNLFGQEGRGQYGELSQMDKGYLDANTTLVTLSMGGNDAKFADIVRQCYVESPFEHCKEDKLKDETESMEVTVPRDISGRVRRSIEVMIKEIAARAPNAKIVLMGYPILFESDCVAGISAEEAGWMNEMGRLMSDTMANLVGTDDYGLRAAGYKVWYSDPTDDFAGEAICGDPETIHTLVLDKTEGDPPELDEPSRQSFHPKISGTYNYRDALQTTLRDPGLNLGP